MFDLDLVDRVGWALIHSVWQIGLIVCLTAITTRLLLRRSANGRYLVSIAALTALAAAPIATFFVTSPQPVPATIANSESAAQDITATVTREQLPESPAGIDFSAGEQDANEREPIENNVKTTEADRPLPEEEDLVTIKLVPELAWQDRMTRSLQPAMPWIVLGWLTGMFLLSARPLIGFLTIHRLRRVGRSDVDERIVSIVRRLCDRIGIKTTIEVAQSALLKVPAVVGCLRPLLLLPVAMGAGLTPQQLEAVIAHELAHIRRHDYLVNVLQTLVETMLFYHPGVWWLSRMVRQEREHCCDDIAMLVCDDRTAYAKALVALDALRRSVPQPAMAATGGSLLQRIRRIMRGEPVASRSAWPVGIALLAMVALLCVAVWPQSFNNTDAAELSPLDSSAWMGTAKIKLEDRVYLLGENVHLQFGITNTQNRSVEINEGGDDRGTPRPLRFKVLAFDSKGQRIADPYSTSTAFFHGGMSTKGIVPPGETHWIQVPLGRYCNFQQPGEYTLRVYHDLGWDKELSHEEFVKNDLPTGNHAAPIAETKIKFAMPSKRQAKRLVDRMAAKLRESGGGNSWREDEVDFATLRQPIYLPYLKELAWDRPESVGAAAVAGIAEIATPEATGELLLLFSAHSKQVGNDAYYKLMGRLPVSSPNGPVRPFWTQYNQQLAANAWNGKQRRRAIEIANHFLITNHYSQLDVSREVGLLHACRILMALGDREQYSDLASSVYSVTATNDRIDDTVARLSEAAWFLFCNRQTLPPQDLDRHIDSAKANALDALTFLRLLTLRDDYRPEGWEDRLRSLLTESCPSMRYFAIQNVPFPFSQDVAYSISQNIEEAWARHGDSQGNIQIHPPLQIAALALAERSRSIYFLPSIRKVIETSKDEQVLAAAQRALAACSRKPILANRNRTEWPQLDFPVERVETLMANFKKREDLPNVVAELREITGLDYGEGVAIESRTGWSYWWSRERSNIHGSADGDRDFLVYGRITDPAGKPLPRAWAEADVSSNFGSFGGVRVAYTLADDDGRYLLRFGFPKNKVPGDGAATVRVQGSDPGDYAALPEDEHRLRVMSRFEVKDDSIMPIRKEDAFYGGHPIEANFTLHPKTRLRVHIVDSDNGPVAPEMLSIRYTPAGASEPIVRPVRLVKDAYFFTSFLPPRSVEFIVQQADDSEPITTPPIALDRVGEYRMILSLYPSEPAGRPLRLTVVEQPESDPKDHPTEDRAVSDDVGPSADDGELPQGRFFGGADALREYLAESDLCLAGTITSEAMGVTGEAYVVNYSCEFDVTEVLCGKCDEKKPRVNIVHFEKTEEDRLPFVRKGGKCILFLKRLPKGNFPVWQSINMRYGTERYSYQLAKAIKRVASERSNDEEDADADSENGESSDNPHSKRIDAIISDLMKQLDSPSPQVREAAASRLRFFYDVLPDRKFPKKINELKRDLLRPLKLQIRPVTWNWRFQSSDPYSVITVMVRQYIRNSSGKFDPKTLAAKTYAGGERLTDEIRVGLDDDTGKPRFTIRTRYGHHAATPRQLMLTGYKRLPSQTSGPVEVGSHQVLLARYKPEVKSGNETKLDDLAAFVSMEFHVEAAPPRKAATIRRYGGEMPQFDLGSGTWYATHIVLADGGNEHDGEFRVIESWKGDLKADQQLSIPELALFKDPATRKISEWYIARADGDKREVVTGRRMILFLIKSDWVDGGDWLSAMMHSGGHRYAMDYSVVWVEDANAFAVKQPRNPGPNMIVPLEGGIAKLKSDVEHFIDVKSRLESALRIEDQAKRADALREFTKSDSWHARRFADEQLDIIRDANAARGHNDAYRPKPVRKKPISPASSLSFESNFADTTDANLFGYPDEGGWIYTAESVKRETPLMQSRRPDVIIAKDEGIRGDCLRFGKKATDVLYYLMNPSLRRPTKNWSGAVTFWIKPDLEKIGAAASYPLQFFDGDWSHGGFFIRLPGTKTNPIELGMVSADATSTQRLLTPEAISSNHHTVISLNDAPIASDRWTFLTMTFENANPEGDGTSLIKFYIDGELRGQTRRLLKIDWMDPDAAGPKPNSATFLGIDYIGDIDEFRIYDRAILEDQILVIRDLAIAAD
ncbi:MAG: M48 family metalloprotease [Planctomycetes bacterium]|nr:M48 family metalloprotease [Planctomycetota bacterium]